MTSILLALALLIPGQAPISPADVWDVAYLHLYETVKAPDRRFTRYFDLHNIPPKISDAQRREAEEAGDLAYDRQDLFNAANFTANSTSYRAEFGRPEFVAGDLLLRIDLRAFAWDYGSRHQRLLELERRGANFNLKDQYARDLFLDPWERIALLDPYYATDPYYYVEGYAGPPYEGWIDPKTEKAARLLSNSRKFVLRGDWAIGRLLQEKDFGGIYSDLLMIPRVEAEYYKTLLIDIKAYEKDNYLLKGGAVLGGDSRGGGVALHNRELQLMPSPYGPDGGYYWRTFDVKVDARFLLDADGRIVKDARGNPIPKSVLEAFRGTIVHDGREAIGTLPNGLHWYRLDGAPLKGQTTGLQAAVVPEDIAQVKEPLLPVKETRVITPYKCYECHLPNNGIYPFDDVVRKTFLAGKKFNFELYGYKDDGLEAALQDYYHSKLGETIERQRADYARRLKECTGLEGTAAAKLVVGVIEKYTHDLVTPADAAVEMGLTLEAARVAWLGSRNPQLFALARGQPIRRAAFEQSFADGMRAVKFPWEYQARKLAPKPQATQPQVPHAYPPARGIPGRPVSLAAPAVLRQAA